MFNRKKIKKTAVPKNIPNRDVKTKVIVTYRIVTLCIVTPKRSTSANKLLNGLKYQPSNFVIRCRFNN